MQMSGVSIDGTPPKDHDDQGLEALTNRKHSQILEKPQSVISLGLVHLEGILTLFQRVYADE